MKISRKLTTALSAGGPSGQAASTCAEAGDIEGLVKIDVRCL